VDEDWEKVWTIKGRIYREVFFLVFEFYQTFYFDSFYFLEIEKGDFNSQLMVKTKNKFDEQTLEDAPYGNNYIGWRKRKRKERY
jgi:hypothetical protein